MKRINVDASIVNTMDFEIFIPEDPSHCFESDLHTVETRNWAIPGEMLYFFIKTSPSVLQLDAITFSPYIVRKSVRSRRSTLMIPVSQGHSAKFIDISSTTTHHGFPSMRPFRLASGHGIYPMCIKVPIDMTVLFSIQVFIPRKSNPIAQTDMKALIPWNVTWEMHSTTVSLVAQFTTVAMLKGSLLHSVQMESTNIAFFTKPPHNEDDFATNIEIVKPGGASIALKDEDSMPSVFIIRPLTEAGASLMSNNMLEFMIDWKYKNLKFTSHFATEVEFESLGFTLLLPPVTTDLMKRVTVPMRITNLRSEKRNVELVFEGGPIQPTAQRIKVPELGVGDSCTVDISLLPLMEGYHKLSFWAEEDGRRIDPLFPTYIHVTGEQK